MKPRLLVLAVLSALLLLSSTPCLANRGLANHNPANITVLKNGRWLGQIGRDGKYAVFIHPYFGIRALKKVLRTYHHKHRIDTCEKLVQRFSKTDQKKYTKFLASQLGVHPRQKISLLERKSELVKAIVRFETGYVID